MRLIQIFLGSSCLLKTQRELIGDEIRKMSSLWECKGIRIRLNCWEDFAPEYIGISKQEEYNGFLVKPSQIFIALIGNRIGYYTNREIDTAIKEISKDNIHCICMPEKATAEEYHRICDQLVEKGLDSLNVYDNEQLIGCVSQIVEKYIEKNYSVECGITPLASPDNQTIIYATIANDVCLAGDVTKAQFGNMIRSLDERLETDFGKRCYLFPYNVLKYITKADYYLSLLKDTFTAEEKNEVFCAFNERSHLHKPICTFIKQDGKITSNHAELQELINRTEAFCCEFNALDTIKLRLFFYLYGAQSSYIDNSSKEFSLKDGRIYFIGSYLANVTGLKDCNSLIQLENELKSVNEQMLQPDAKRFDLWNKQTSLKAQISQKLLVALNEFLLSDRYLSDYDSSEEIDYSLAVEACHNEDDIYKSCSQLNIQQKQKRVNHIINRIEYIRKSNERNCIKDEIRKALKALYTNVSSLSELPLESPDKLIQAMFYMVSLSETYDIHRMQDFDEDNLYGLIIKTADKYKRLSPNIETMRINYANSFSRKLNHSMANKLYLQAVENMNKFDDSTVYIRRRICGAYTFAIEHLMDVEIHTESVFQLFAAYHEKLVKWSKAGEPFYIGECMYWASKLKCLLSEDNLMELINNAERAYDNVLQYSPLFPEDSAYSDVCCYLPNNIAAYYIDNFRDEELQSGMPAFEKIIKYSEIEINNAIRLTKVDEIHGKVFIAKTKHQLGFLFTKQDNLYHWGKVLPLYKEAYKIRKEIYNTTLQPADELEVAETATNIGGFICQILGYIEFVKSTPLWNVIKEDVLSNKYSFADEAVAIYSRHITWGETEKEMNYYKALQLKGSLLYVCAEKQIPDGNKEEGIKLMKQAYVWNIQHPLNNYKDVFESISGDILRMEQII